MCVDEQWVPCAGPAKPDPWTGVPGAFLGILGRVELAEGQDDIAGICLAAAKPYPCS